MNIAILIGRMTRDPELKYTSGGKAYTNFTLAVQKTKDEAEFIDCVAWEKTAENIAEYFRKGNRILIQGRLSVNNYEQNREKRKFTKTIVAVKMVTEIIMILMRTKVFLFDSNYRNK